MTQYLITFGDRSTEYLEAYGYDLSNGRATFDMGKGHTFVLMDVVTVEVVG